MTLIKSRSKRFLSLLMIVSLIFSMSGCSTCIVRFGSSIEIQSIYPATSYAPEFCFGEFTGGGGAIAGLLILPIELSIAFVTDTLFLPFDYYKARNWQMEKGLNRDRESKRKFSP